MFNGKLFVYTKLHACPDCIGENIFASSANNNKFTEEPRTVGKSLINNINEWGPK